VNKFIISIQLVVTALKKILRKHEHRSVQDYLNDLKSTIKSTDRIQVITNLF